MASTGMACIKYLLHLFTLITGLTGLAILATSLLFWWEYNKYSEFISVAIYSPLIILMVVGSILFILAFVGWCGTVRDSHCLLIMFASMVFIIFFLEIAIGVFGYVERDNANELVEKKLYEYVPKYQTNLKVQATWNVTQNDFECCGVKSFTDWKGQFTGKDLPHSCCKGQDVTIPCTDDFVKSHNIPGCLPKFRDYISSNILIVGGVCVGFALLQLIAILFACSLARLIRQEYETV